MKKILFTIILAGAVFASCGTRSAKKQSDNTNGAETKTVQLDKAGFISKVADLDNPDWKYLGDKPAIIDFYADWCGPCKTIAPVLEELAAEYEGRIVIYKIDVDKEQELAAAFGVQSIPTLLFIPLDGQPQVSRGAAGKAELESHIKSILPK